MSGFEKRIFKWLENNQDEYTLNFTPPVYSSAVQCFELYCTELYWAVLYRYCNVFYCTVMYSIVLQCIVLHLTIQPAANRVPYPWRDAITSPPSSH